MTAAIELSSLRKVFRVRERAAGMRSALRQLVSAPVREVVAVDDIGFRVERGERVAFVGPNGAGKSTSSNLKGRLLGHR